MEDPKLGRWPEVRVHEHLPPQVPRQEVCQIRAGLCHLMAEGLFQAGCTQAQDGKQKQIRACAGVECGLVQDRKLRMEVSPVGADVGLHHTQAKDVMVIVFVAFEDLFLLLLDWRVVGLVESSADEVDQVSPLLLGQCYLWK